MVVRKLYSRVAVWFCHDMMVVRIRIEMVGIWALGVPSLSGTIYLIFSGVLDVF